MKRYKDFVIGGIESKIFNLILISLLIITIAYMTISIAHSKMLSNLVEESSAKQEESITNTTNEVMDQQVKETLTRANRMEAGVADQIFAEMKDMLTFYGERAEYLFSHSDEFEPKPYSLPDPADDEKWVPKIMYADDTDPSDTALISKLGLISNMSDMMIDFCTSFGAANAYIATPEGAHLTISNTSSTWYENGELKHYDPRTRGWYQKAVETGKLIFTDGEYDANTGAYCVEAAIPVYDEAGALQAVIGADIYLDNIQHIMSEYSLSGEYYLVLNQNGHAILSPEGDTFPMSKDDYEGDVRNSKNEFLAKIATDALKGDITGVRLGELENGSYYLIGRMIETTGWVLITAYNQETSVEYAGILQKNIEEIQNSSAEEYQAKIGKYRLISFFIIILLLLLMLANSLFLGKRIVKPLNTMTQKIASLSEGNLEFKMEDIYRTGDEVEELAQSFSTLSHRSIEYMNELVNVTAEKERIGAELTLANNIQTAMLPHIFPAFPNRSDFDVYASMDPAKEVGGDFYDYFLIDDDHLGMIIADVSGKGIPAALFMMASKIILQSVAMLGNSPAEVLTKTNEALCSNNEAEMFVTVWIGILELSTGKLTASNAGHEYPAIMGPDGKFVLYKDKHGFVLGGMEGIKFHEYELTLEPGSKIFLYTDGVPEATNANEELFGTDRMVDALNSNPKAKPEEVLKNVRKHVDIFVEEAEQFDDLTMLCMEYKG